MKQIFEMLWNASFLQILIGVVTGGLIMIVLYILLLWFLYKKTRASQMIDMKSRKVKRMTKTKHATTGTLAFVGLMAIVYVLYLLVFNFPKLAVLFT